MNAIGNIADGIRAGGIEAIADATMERWFARRRRGVARIDANAVVGGLPRDRQVGAVIDDAGALIFDGEGNTRHINGRHDFNQ